MSILTKEIAREMFTANGFTVTDVDNSGCDGTYYFRMWTEHQNGFGISIMQFIGKDVIDVHIMKDGDLFCAKESPFDGRCKAYPTPGEFNALLERVAKSEFTNQP
jgi:hypothetical protein